MPKRSSVNEGIQANNVTADVLAVGKGATAKKIAVTRAAEVDELRRSVLELRQLIERLPATEEQRKTLEVEVKSVEKSLEGTLPSKTDRKSWGERFSTLVKNMSQVGEGAASLLVVVKKVADLWGGLT